MLCVPNQVSQFGQLLQLQLVIAQEVVTVQRALIKFRWTLCDTPAIVATDAQRGILLTLQRSMQAKNRCSVKLALTKTKKAKVYVSRAQQASIVIMKTQLNINNAQQGSFVQEVPRLETSSPVHLVITAMLAAKLLELIVNYATWATTAS